MLAIIALTATTGVVSVLAANLFGTPRPDTLVSTNNDDNIYEQEGNDRIKDGLGSDKLFAGSGDDIIKLGETGEDDSDRDAQDVVYGEEGRDNIDAQSSSGSFLLIYGGDDDDTFFVEVGARWENL
jgi:hypothetical protein